MAVVALDTHAVVKELQAAGFSEAQAEAVTRAVRRAQDPDLSNLATKLDVQALRGELQELRAETKADIQELRAGTKADVQAVRGEVALLRSDLKGDVNALRGSTQASLSDLRSDLLKWLLGAMGLQTIAILGAVVAIVRVLVPR